MYTALPEELITILWLFWSFWTALIVNRRGILSRGSTPPWSVIHYPLSQIFLGGVNLCCSAALVTIDWSLVSHTEYRQSTEEHKTYPSGIPAQKGEDLQYIFLFPGINAGNQVCGKFVVMPWNPIEPYEVSYLPPSLPWCTHLFGYFLIIIPCVPALIRSPYEAIQNQFPLSLSWRFVIPHLSGITNWWPRVHHVILVGLIDLSDLVRSIPPLKLRLFLYVALFESGIHYWIRHWFERLEFIFYTIPLLPVWVMASPKYLTGDQSAINHFIDQFDVRWVSPTKALKLEFVGWIKLTLFALQVFLFDCDGIYDDQFARRKMC